MKIKLNSVMIEDQRKALKFYTEVLGLVKNRDISMGEHSWLTVVSPEEKDGAELVLAGIGFEASKVYQKALYDARIPATGLEVQDVQNEFERLEKLGVRFCGQPVIMGPVIQAMFDDTCGNYIQIYQILE